MARKAYKQGSAHHGLSLSRTYALLCAIFDFSAFLFVDVLHPIAKSSKNSDAGSAPVTNK